MKEIIYNLQSLFRRNAPHMHKYNCLVYFSQRIGFTYFRAKQYIHLLTYHNANNSIIHIFAKYSLIDPLLLKLHCGIQVFFTAFGNISHNSRILFHILKELPICILEILYALLIKTKNNFQDILCLGSYFFH